MQDILDYIANDEILKLKLKDYTLITPEYLHKNNYQLKLGGHVIFFDADFDMFSAGFLTNIIANDCLNVMFIINSHKNKEIKLKYNKYYIFYKFKISRHELKAELFKSLLNQ